MIIAGFSVRSAVESAKKAGIAKLIAVDFFGDWDLCRLASRVELVRSLKELELRLSLYPEEKIIYTSVLENHPAILRRLGERILGNEFSVVEVLRPGIKWWELASRLGISIPRVSLTPPSDGRWLMKPYKSGGGKGINFWKEGMRLKRGYYFQEFIEGESISFLFVANGREFSPVGITKQLIGLQDLGAGGFKWCGNVYPYHVNRIYRDRIEDWVGRLVESTGFKGVGGVDIVIGEKGPYFIEVNPRYTASMELIERSTGTSLMIAHISACRGELINLFLRPRGYIAKGIVYAERRLTGFKSERMWERGFRDIPHEDELIPRGRPVCTVFAVGNSIADVLNKLLEEKMWLYERGIG
ncbi:MAG: ATP-grasp domain-containing protein [Synergistetes bacterium]|nr:ATP-grasp domain-containing protein [Synergistota bacterium]